MNTSITIRQIIRACALEYGVRPSYITGPRRYRTLIEPRHVAMFLCRDLTEASYPEIGRAFHRDHTTVINGERRIEQTSGPDTAERMRKIRQRLTTQDDSDTCNAQPTEVPTSLSLPVTQSGSDHGADLSGGGGL